jgi:hypothetical protein
LPKSVITRSFAATIKTSGEHITVPRLFTDNSREKNSLAKESLITTDSNPRTDSTRTKSGRKNRIILSKSALLGDSPARGTAKNFLILKPQKYNEKMKNKQHKKQEEP